MKCRRCGFDHGLDTCDVARRKREYAERLSAPVVANTVMVANVVVANGSRHGVHKKTEARKTYMRELMRKRRTIQ